MSLRNRLLIALGLVALIALVAADVATYSALHSFLYNRIDQTLESTAGAFGPGPGGSGPGPGGGPGGPPVQVPARAQGLFVERITASGDVEYSYGAYEPSGKRYVPALSASELSAPTSGGVFFTAASATAGGPPFEMFAVSTQDGDRVFVGQPLDQTDGTLHDLFLIELAVTASALLVAIALGLWLVRLGLRPLRQVEETAEGIARGDLTRRVPGDDRPTEVGRLARVLNVMLGRIERAFEERDATEAALRRSEGKMRRFVADASHELRTPLAAVSAYAELYGRGGSEHPEDLGRIMTGIEGEAARMRSLVEDLFLLARLDEGRPFERQPVDLVAMLGAAVDAARAVGPGWPVALRATEPIEVLGDVARLRQVADNLLANVRAHTPPGTTATVTLRPEGTFVAVEFADNGPGITEEQAAQVFERFYRADPSRSRTSGGSGLGLSIVAAIVEAHGGSVSAAAGNPGSVFTVRLPAQSGGTDEVDHGGATAAP